MSAIQAIIKERERQIAFCKHGGDTEQFDKSNTQNDWVAYIIAYAGRAAQKVHKNEQQQEDFRSNLIKVGALVLAAIDAYDEGYCK